MKLSLLKEICTHEHKRVEKLRDGDPSVLIRSAQGCVPINRMIEVRSCYCGGDWEKNMFVIVPNEPLVVCNVLNKPIRDFARERLDFIKKSYNAMKFHYIAKAREEEWIDGFVEGIKSMVTSIDTDK